MRTSRFWAALAVAVSIGGTAAAEEMWSIGSRDDSYEEFACARNYSIYGATFPTDPVFRVGSSAPDRDWSYIHPGPSDSWAGSRRHPFRIEFDLPTVPPTPLRLLVDLVDVHGLVPTKLRVQVNEVSGEFALSPGRGDATLRNPAHGSEQTVAAVVLPSMLKAGTNVVTLESIGSWILYDAITLEATKVEALEAPLRGLALEPTVMYRRNPDGPGLLQVVIARLETSAPIEGGELHTVLGDRALPSTRVPASLTWGTVECEVLVPRVSAEMPLRVSAKIGDQVATADTRVKPERLWRIYVAPSTHTDIGYTDFQERVVQRHIDNTDRAIELCQLFPSFGWNLEVAWQADIYAKHRGRGAARDLWELARQGRIGITSGYLNMLTGLCSHEELNRWLYHGAELRRECGVPFTFALTTDVPTQVWSVPSTLAAAGIRYYATGINTTRGYTFTKLMSGWPYWWEGPDGSRVLAYFAPGYAHAWGPFQSLEELKRWVRSATTDRANSPYDALFLYGGLWDNAEIADALARTAEEWAQHYEYPKMIVGPNDAYFRYMEETYGDQLPVIAGDAGVYWEDGAASSARETTQNRRAHELASAADACFAFVQAIGGPKAPKSRLAALWRNVLLYDEHTWGAWCSISDPDCEQTVKQWEVKASFAHASAQQGRDLSREGLSALAGLVRTGGPSLVVLNATSWERTGDVLETDLPDGLVPADPASRLPLPTVRLDGRALVRVPSVPAWGYVALPLVPGNPPEATTAECDGPPVLENSDYRIAFAAETAGLASIVDKATGRELVDQASGHSLNGYLYVSGGDNSRIVDIAHGAPAQLTLHAPTGATFTRITLPGLGERVVASASCMNTPRLETSVTLWDGLPRVDFANVVTRVEERAKEAAYFAFPFALDRPDVRIEIPNGVLRPEVDQLPGACRDWYCTQHWVRLSDGACHIAWASPDAPLLCIQDINRGLWQEEISVQNGRLYSYIMNNYWFTNYKAGQDGDHEFRYSLTTRSCDTDALAARFGWQAAMPLQAVLVESAQDGPLPGGALSICSVRPAEVMVTAIKPSEVGSRTVVRLFSLANRPLTAELKLGVGTVRSAILASLVEEPIEELPFRDNTVRVPVRPMAPTTVLVR